MDCQLCINRERWNPGEHEKANFHQFEVRPQRQRWFKNKWFHDISKDPGQTRNLADQHPEVTKEL